ncbi:YEATS domain-containing protein 4 [Boothiomyces macroporosus]|uniref:Protein AF-9 homolog n=1 Tax=Boothiomyces macroporosus TaxID=261099 RepID=A0AAD5UEH9_9FUNG|nr:YEATS domain-containing protein 4 [Boothiomyces macroporosus]
MQSRPIVYGSFASLVTKNDTVSDPNHTHKWKVYLKGADGEDISYFIEKVVFKLHESFAVPIREIKSPPFQVSETGWGEFNIAITMHFVDPNEPPITVNHMLQLYHKDDNPLQKKYVVSEHFDELVFTSPNNDLYDALVSNPLDSLDRPHPSSTFTDELEVEEIEQLTAINEKVLAEIEIKRVQLAQLEEELRIINENKAAASTPIPIE